MKTLLALAAAFALVALPISALARGGRHYRKFPHKHLSSGRCKHPDGAWIRGCR